MTGVWTPQWLYRHITIDSGETIRLDPGAFMNNQPWPLHLKWLSLAGLVTVDDSGEFSSLEGGLARRLQFELSLTQKGDINNLISNSQTIFTDHQVGLPGYQNRYDFSPPFPLGPEEGIVVEQAANEMVLRNTNPSVMFTGVRKDPRLGVYAPAHLGAMHPTTLYAHNSVTFNSTDLFNNGDETFWINQMLLDSGSGDTLLYSDEYKLGVAWRVNPNSGIQWMPNPLPIPTPNLAPLTIYELDVEDLGCNVYVFPKVSLLKPRQRLGIEVTNISDSQQQFGLCLHGILEVL